MCGHLRAGVSLLWRFQLSDSVGYFVRPTPEQRAENEERAMLDKLSALARGVDPVYLLPISHSEMLEAQKRYFDLKASIDQRKLAKAQLDQSYEIEHRKLDIEAERVNVQKAEVMVRALEVAANSGVNPEILLGAIRELGANLLAGPAASTLRLEKKDK